jgi:hypothetical protein
MRRPFIARGFGGDDVVTAVFLPYYGALAGARTAGAARTARVRRHGGTVRGASIGGMRREAGPRVARGLRQRRALGRRAGRGRRGSAGAQPATRGARARDIAACRRQGLKRSAEP